MTESPSAPAANPPSNRNEKKRVTGLALPLWKAAFAAECRGSRGGVWNPILARIARTTPRAIGNGPIEDSELFAFFRSDYEGYTGEHVGLLGLEQEVGRCMVRLEGYEIGLRESGAWVVSRETEARLLQSPAVIEQLIQVGALSKKRASIAR